MYHDIFRQKIGSLPHLIRLVNELHLDVIKEQSVFNITAIVMAKDDPACTQIPQAFFLLFTSFVYYSLPNLFECLFNVLFRPTLASNH